MTRPWHLSPVLIPFLVLSACSCDDTEPEQATVDATLSTIEADSPVSIHGDTFSLVTVTVLDADGSPIPGVEIELAGSREGQDLITQPSSLTDEEGIAEGRVSSTVAGTTTISAIAGGIELEAGAEIEFVDEQDCPDDQIWCGEETGCVTLGTTEHCSTCDDACQAPDNAEASCEGSCTWSCVDGWASCDGDDETGCETELGTLENCLDCGDACEEYANSTAVCDEDGCGLVCDEGWGSCDGELETGCETELEGGECPPKDCPEGQVDCGTAGCVELGTEEHCLECHDECEAPANAVGVCGFDGCTFVCLQGFGDCDGDASNGCEEELDGEGLCPSGCPPGEEDCGGGCVPLDTVDHCGDCQTSCEAPANSTAVCLPTGCSFECDDGFGDCDGDASNGCEQSLDDDLHCGACGAACENPPNATAFCSDGETGTCGYECEEGFADCDSDPANGCETDLSAATCCDFESFITLSSPCLTAEAGGVTVAHVEVRDITGQRVPGASVTLDAGSLQVLDQVTESASQPGVYYARIATPEQPGDYQIAASATYEGEWVCGAQVSIAPVTLTVAPPASPVEGGTGGCIPRGGNLRVRAVDEQGQPLEGAFVMAGSSVGETFYSDYETVLLGESGDVQNHTLTDADGYAVFQDLGGQLSDPSIMVTAGASGRAYASAQGFDAADMVLVLEALPPPPDRVTLEGGVTPSYASNNTGRIGLALVTQSLTVETLARFDFMEMLEADKTVRVGGDLCMAGTMDLILPGNIHFPDQNHLGCSLTATPPDWYITPPRGTPVHLPALQGDIGILDAMNAGEDMATLINSVTFRKVGIETDVGTSVDQSGLGVELSADLEATMPVSAVNAPSGELWLLSVGDREGGNGDGTLFLQGVKVENPASSLSATLTTAKPEGDFTATSHMAMALSMVAGEGASAVLDRVNTDRNTQRTLDEFFSVPGTASASGRTFYWNAVANSNSPPDYHVGRSVLKRVTQPGTGEYRSEEEPFWYVYTPAGVRGFDLPTLPSHAPRSGTQGYLLPNFGQSNRWFLGLYYMGLNGEPQRLTDGEIDFSEIERDLTHLSITQRSL